MNQKPGYKSSEFIATIATTLAALGCAVFGLNTENEVVQQILPIVGVAASALMTSKYTASRTKLKEQEMTKQKAQ